MNKKEKSVDDDNTLYEKLRHDTAPIQRNINDIEKDMRVGTNIYHHSHELLTMLKATSNLCVFVLERGIKYVEIEKGQELVQTAITAYKRYVLVATEAEQAIHDFEDTIFFLQWLLTCPQTDN